MSEPTILESLLLYLAFLVVGLIGAYGIHLFEAAAKERKEKEQEPIRRAWDDLVDRVLENPSDTSLHFKVLEFLKNHPNHSEGAYRLSLDLVAGTKANHLNKIFALHVGRVHYSRGRKDRVPTVYDEAAIENDIKARC